MSRPIRVFWNPLSQRFYASRAYKQIKPGQVLITGQQFDVTNDIAAQVIEHDIVFTPAAQQPTKPEETRCS